MTPPVCKLCRHAHWLRAPHIFPDDPGPRPALKAALAITIDGYTLPGGVVPVNDTPKSPESPGKHFATTGNNGGNAEVLAKASSPSITPAVTRYPGEVTSVTPKASEVTRECEICGKAFKPSKATQRLCSGACKQKAYRLRQAKGSNDQAHT
jgi:hypothetical protein